MRSKDDRHKRHMQRLARVHRVHDLIREAYQREEQPPSARKIAEELNMTEYEVRQATDDVVSLRDEDDAKQFAVPFVFAHHPAYGYCSSEDVEHVLDWLWEAQQSREQGIRDRRALLEERSIALKEKAEHIRDLIAKNLALAIAEKTKAQAVEQRTDEATQTLPVNQRRTIKRAKQNSRQRKREAARERARKRRKK